MAYKLAIDDLVGVNVKGKTQNKDGSEKPFKFVLVCERKSNEEMKTVLADSEGTAFAFFEANARDWQGQKLVLDDEGNPAPFSLDALRVLLSVSGMAMLCWQSYFTQVGATAKN